MSIQYGYAPIMCSHVLFFRDCHIFNGKFAQKDLPHRESNPGRLRERQES